MNEGSVLISHCALDLLSTTHGYVRVGVVSIYRLWIEMILSGGNRMYVKAYMLGGVGVVEEQQEGKTTKTPLEGVHHPRIGGISLV